MWLANFCLLMEDGALAHCAKCTEKLISYACLGINLDQSGSQSNSELTKILTENLQKLWKTVFKAVLK